jgi:hypothetical protein
MVAAPTADTEITLPFCEFCLTVVAVGLCFAFPRLGSSFFRSIERRFSALANRKHLSVFVTGIAAMVLRLSILPWCPIPLPFCTDDFSFLLASDTFLHGRLANPTPNMWVHFETIHVDMLPTYGSMYFPGYGLVLAAGKLLFGHPWFGVLFTSALMCAAICWMLQAWLPPKWALLGGAISILHLGLYSYWINSYHSAGTLVALGGALVLGSLPRLKRTMQMRYGILMAVGIAIQILTRPYEGFLLCLPVAISLCHWMLSRKNRPQFGLLLRRAILPITIIGATLIWLGYYDHAAFGKATVLPYTVNRATYATAPYFVWQNARPEPAYRHAELRRFYRRAELDLFEEIQPLKGYLRLTAFKGIGISLFFSGFALIPPLLMIRRVFLDRRIRFLTIGLLVLACGMSIQIFAITHYVAGFTASFYAVGLQAMRHLRVWKPGGKSVGLTMTRMCVSVCIVMAVLRLFAAPLGFPLKEWPVIDWNFIWYGPGHFGTERASIDDHLEHQPGKQLAIVYHGLRRSPIDEWVYNTADIDGQKVIWARSMDLAHNAELISYYKDRQVWLVNADRYPAKLEPYSVQAQLNLSSEDNGPMPYQGMDPKKESKP